MKSKDSAVIVAPSNEALELLKNSYPIEEGYNKIQLPRLEYVAQDKMEGEGKNKKCVIEAGTFFTNKESTEKNAEGKIVWDKQEIGKEIEATIVYNRKQLKFFDQSTDSYTNSSIYDQDDEVIPLFCSNVKIASGTPAELKKRYEYTNEEGKVRSKLEDNKILYVLLNGEVYQLTLRGSSMYSFKTFARGTTLIPAQLTRFSSEPKEKGSTKWNCMTFSKVRDLSMDEVVNVQDKVNEISGAILAEKRYYAKEKAIASTPIEYPTEVAGGESIPF